MTLKDLKPGQTVRIITVGGEGALRQHFLDMGVIPGAEATLVKLAPMGDPMELRIHGYELTLRVADAQQIEVSAIVQKAPVKEQKGKKPRFSSETGWVTRIFPDMKTIFRIGTILKFRRKMRWMVLQTKAAILLPATFCRFFSSILT